MTYSWRGQWEWNIDYKPNDVVEYDTVAYICIKENTASSANVPGIDDPNNSWAHYWEEMVKKKGHSGMKDPFHYDGYDLPVRKGKPKKRFMVMIEEGKDIDQIVYHDIHEQDTAMKLTARLNNAIYRWMVKEGIVT